MDDRDEILADLSEIQRDRIAVVRLADAEIFKSIHAHAPRDRMTHAIGSSGDGPRTRGL